MIYQRRVRPGGARRPHSGDQEAAARQRALGLRQFAEVHRHDSRRPGVRGCSPRPRVGRAVQEVTARRRAGRLRPTAPRIDRDRLAAGSKTARVDERRIDQDRRVGDQRGGRLQVEAAGDRDADARRSRTGPGWRASWRDARVVRPRRRPRRTPSCRPRARRRRRACPAPRSGRPGAGRRASAARVDSVSARRDGAPGRVMTATSSSTTAVSSTNTESGRSGSGRNPDDGAAGRRSASS